MRFSFFADDWSAIFAAVLAAYGLARVGGEPTLVVVETCSAQACYLARLRGGFEVRTLGKHASARDVVELASSSAGNLVGAFPGHWLRRAEILTAMDASVVTGVTRGEFRQAPVPAANAAWHVPGLPRAYSDERPRRELPFGLPHCDAASRVSLAEGRPGPRLLERGLALAAALELAAAAGEAGALGPDDLTSLLSHEPGADPAARRRLLELADAVAEIDPSERGRLPGRQSSVRPIEGARRRPIGLVARPVPAAAIILRAPLRA